MEPATPRHSYLREAAAVVAGSLLASVAFTWPLVLHLQSRARDLVDTLFQAWTIDWVQHAIGSGLNPYNANIFAPEKTSLAFSDTLLGVAIPTFPLRWLGMTPIGVLNVTIIVGFAASAAAAYLFAPRRRWIPTARGRRGCRVRVRPVRCRSRRVTSMSRCVPACHSPRPRPGGSRTACASASRNDRRAGSSRPPSVSSR